MDELLEVKLFAQFALSVSRGRIDKIQELLSAVPIQQDAQYFTLRNVLLVLLVALPNATDPAELIFLKDVICGKYENGEEDLDYGELIQAPEIHEASHLQVLSNQLASMLEIMLKQAGKYGWDPEQLLEQNKALFMFVRVRTLKISLFHNENLFFNEELFNFVPQDYEPFISWKKGFLEPLHFAITYNIRHGIIARVPDVVEFESNLHSEDDFDYLVKTLNSENVHELMVNTIVPFCEYNGLWSSLQRWLHKKDLLMDDDYRMLLGVFNFFFNDYLSTHRSIEFLRFLDSFIEEYLYKIYLCNLLTDQTLGVLSETVQQFIAYAQDNDEQGQSWSPDMDHTTVDDERLRLHFCRKTMPSLDFLAALIDLVGKLVKITNENELLMLLTQFLLISLAPAPIQLNFARLLIHNYKVNDVGGASSLGYWETFLINFNWLVESSVLFRNIREGDGASRITEIVFEMMLEMGYDELIKAHLNLDFEQNSNLKRILLRHCWRHYLNAVNFSLERGELLTTVQFLKILMPELTTEIQSANNFFVINKGRLDVYKPEDDARFFEFDLLKVGGKKLEEFAKSTEDVSELSEDALNRDFISGDIDFEILKFKKLLLASNQLATNFKFLLSQRAQTLPSDIFKVNNPIIVLERILELNPKSYLDMGKIYKVVADLCISTDHIGLLYDVLPIETDTGPTEDLGAVFSGKGAPLGPQPRFPLRDKVILSCVNAALIDLNFDFAYTNLMRLLANETGTLLGLLGHVWLNVFQVCKFVDPAWLVGSDEDDDIDDVPLDVLTRQIELALKLLEVAPSATTISTVENSVILTQSEALLRKYRHKLERQVVSDFARYQGQQNNSLFQNFNASTGTLLNQFTKNASSLSIGNGNVLTVGRRSQLPQDSIDLSPISAFDLPRNSQVDSVGTHQPVRMGQGPGLENRFVRAFASSANEIFNGEQGSLSPSQSSGRLNLLAGEEQIKNLFVSGLGWAIGANPGEANR